MRQIWTSKCLICTLISILASLFSPMCMASYFNGAGESDHIYEIDGVIYKVLCWYETPIQLEVVGVNKELFITNSHGYLEINDLELPEELTINSVYYDTNKPQLAKIIKIGERAFAKSTIDGLKLPSSLRIIGKEAFMDSGIQNMELPEGLITIEEKAFYKADVGRHFKVPESVIYLGYGCFWEVGYSVRSFDLPSTLKAFGGNVFYFTGMYDLYIRAEVPPVALGCDFGFNNTYIGPAFDCETGPGGFATLHVPAQSVGIYKSTYPYNWFEIVPIEEEAGDDDEPSSGVEPTGAGFCDFTVNDGVLTVSCRPGDTLHLYDAGGLLLESRSYTSPAEYTYAGSGVRILSVNGKSYKIVL